MKALLLSSGNRLDKVWHSPVIEAEDSIRAFLDADVIEMNVHRRSTFRLQAVRTRFDPVPPIRLSSGSRPRPADVGVVVFPNGSVVSSLRLVKGWKSLAKRWIAVVHEIWPSHVVSEPDAIAEVFADFDAVSVMTNAGCLEFNQRFPNQPVSFAPFAIDGRRLTHRPPDKRGVTLFNPGRRDPIQHGSLLAATGDELYLFDTFAAGVSADLRVHRQTYLRTVSHSRLMVTNYAKFDAPQERNNAVEAGLRLTEALGGGAVPIGDHPSSIEMAGLDRNWFGPRFPVGQPVDRGAIRDLLADTALAERVAFEGPRFVALQHDWSNRISELLQRIGLSAPESLLEHQALLQQRWSS